LVLVAHNFNCGLIYKAPAPHLNPLPKGERKILSVPLSLRGEEMMSRSPLPKGRGRYSLSPSPQRGAGRVRGNVHKLFTHD